MYARVSESQKTKRAMQLEKYVFRLQDVRSHFEVYFTEHELFPKYVTPSATYLRCEVI